MPLGVLFRHQIKLSIINNLRTNRVLTLRILSLVLQAISVKDFLV